MSTNTQSKCLGNHDFDNGVSGLIPFIKNLKCPVLTANLNLTKVPELQAESNLLNSVVFDINGTKVGIIGYLTPETKTEALKNDVEYIEEVAAIKKEAIILKDKGVNILIALGHSGYIKDLEIAREVTDIDLVIGGHSHTFLWNGIGPDVEEPLGPYPTMVEQDSGKVVPTVQAYANTKYLGKILLTFDAYGDLAQIEGKPILLDNSIPQDPDVLEIVNDYKEKVQEFTTHFAGSTLVNLDGHSCRLRECNLGNLLADAVTYKYMSEYGIHNLSSAPAAFAIGGSIRTSIAHAILPANITRGDLIQVVPFEDLTIKMSVNGSIIKKMFEHSVAKYNPLKPSGGFFQVSGMKVEYDFSQAPGKRVDKVYMRCSDSQYEILNTEKTYEILVPGFTVLGGNGFSFLSNLPYTQLDFIARGALAEYLAHNSPVSPRIEGRIIIRNREQYNKTHLQEQEN